MKFIGFEEQRSGPSSATISSPLMPMNLSRLALIIAQYSFSLLRFAPQKSSLQKKSRVE
jgi:hypothetical protein